MSAKSSGEQTLRRRRFQPDDPWYNRSGWDPLLFTPSPARLHRHLWACSYPPRRRRCYRTWKLG